MYIAVIHLKIDKDEKCLLNDYNKLGTIMLKRSFFSLFFFLYYKFN